MLDIAYLNNHFAHLPAEELLRFVLANSAGGVALSTSFSIEDQVLTDILLQQDPPARIFTLDTGRLPFETYAVLDWTRERYGIEIETYAADPAALDRLYRRQGANGFYDTVENRKRCCHVRKVDPLQQALRNTEVWITGLRRAQGTTRPAVPLAERDDRLGVIKINPLVHWNDADVWSYIKWNKIAYSALYDQGYTSIGCAPCTRAVRPGEDSRAGRWWWEQPEHRECGLHLKEEA